MMFQSRETLIALIAIIFGISIGYSMAYVRNSSQMASIFKSFYPIRIHNDDFPLINSLVAYERPEATTLKQYGELKTQLQNHIDDAGDSLESTSIYYRNLNTGDWIGINQYAFYYPASLLKVPVMIAFFREAENAPDILQTRIIYEKISGGDAFDMQSSLVPGTSYSYEELIERMIIDSDNGAAYTLLENIDQQVLDEVYTDIGISKPDPLDSMSYQISTRTYALFFRILYSATYLTPEYSQKALELLSRTTYRDGLAAGVPEGTLIIHKYGEHIVSSDRTTVEGVELHDCGIIYRAGQHYLACVMTRAKTIEKASALIQSVSKIIYENATLR